MEQKVNLPFCKIEDKNLPFVYGEFACKDGTYKKGYFFVDSGAQQNLFNEFAVQFIDENCFTGKQHNLTALDNKGEKTESVNLNFKLNGEDLTDEFCITHNINFYSFFEAHCVIGILGMNFLVKHGLIVDFEKRCLRTYENESLDFSEMDYCMPMQYGFETYGIPIVGILNGEKQFLCVADTGCNISTFAQKTAEEGFLKYELTNEVFKKMMVSGTVMTRGAHATLPLFSMADNEERFKIVEVSDTVNIMMDRDYFSTNSNDEITPICGAIGVKFMLAHKWILDFEHMVIYSRKTSK